MVFDQSLTSSMKSSVFVLFFTRVSGSTALTCQFSVLIISGSFLSSCCPQICVEDFLLVGEGEKKKKAISLERWGSHNFLKLNEWLSAPSFLIRCVGLTLVGNIVHISGVQLCNTPSKYCIEGHLPSPRS